MKVCLFLFWEVFFFLPLLLPIPFPRNRRWIKYMAIDNRIETLNLKISVENFLHLSFKNPKVNEQNYLSLLKIMLKVKKYCPQNSL